MNIEKRTKTESGKLYWIKKMGGNMAKSMKIAVIAGIAIIIGVIIFQISNLGYERSTTEEYYDSIGKGTVAHLVYPLKILNFYMV